LLKLEIKALLEIIRSHCSFRYGQQISGFELKIMYLDLWCPCSL